MHDARVSLISGIYILTNIYLYFIISKLNYSNLNNIIFENYIIISFITAIFIVGYIDDKKGINPFLRLVFFSIILFAKNSAFSKPTKIFAWPDVIF